MGRSFYALDDWHFAGNRASTWNPRAQARVKDCTVIPGTRRAVVDVNGYDVQISGIEMTALSADG